MYGTLVNMEPSFKLTPASRDMLLAVGLGCVTHYPASRGAFRAEWFAQMSPVGLNAVCPRVVNATASGRGLLRLGMIKPFADLSQSYRTALLTTQGQRLFAILVNAEQKAALVRHAAEEARHVAERDQRERQQRFREEHKDVLQALRERGRQRAWEEHMLRTEMAVIAEQLGRRPNDVEPLLARLRAIVDRLDAILAEGVADAAATPRLEGDGLWA
jgi:hypothetical protein